MITHAVSVTLTQTPEDAFAFFSDFPNEPAWNPECLAVEKTSPGPVDVGTTYLGRMRGIGRIRTEIVAFDRPRGLATVERSGVATGNFEFRFLPAGGGTRVEVSMRLQPRGPMRLLQPLMGRMVGRMLAELPGHMQAGIEAAHPAA
jgi:carbon monoxide dehydrogenase subunit G